MRRCGEYRLRKYFELALNRHQEAIHMINIQLTEAKVQGQVALQTLQRRQPLQVLREERERYQRV